MKQFLFALVCLTSLLLSVLTASAWGVSYVRPTTWHHLRMDHDPDRVAGPPLAISMNQDVGVSLALHGDESHQGQLQSVWVRSRRGQLSLLVQHVEVAETSLWLVVTGPNDLIVWAGDGQLRMWTPQVSHEGWWYRLGFALETKVDEFVADPESFGIIDAQVSLIVVPYWCFALLGIPVPLIWLRGKRRARRWAQRGLCAGCGYDLRESPTRCPECGRSTAPSPEIQPT